MNSNQLFDFILAEFDIPCDSKSKSQQLMKAQSLAPRALPHGGNRRLIIDEAQNLTYPVLEEIRLLTNLETSTDKLCRLCCPASPNLRRSSGLPPASPAPAAHYASLPNHAFVSRTDKGIHCGAPENCRRRRGTHLQHAGCGHRSSLFSRHPRVIQSALRALAGE